MKSGFWAASALAFLPLAAHGQDTLAAAPAFSLPPVEDFAAMVERPLFAADRRPSAASAPQAAAPPPPNLALLGIVQAPHRSLALIAEGSAAARTMGEGDTVGGWSIESIASERLVLRHGETVHEILLWEAPAPKRAAVRPRHK